MSPLYNLRNTFDPNKFFFKKAITNKSFLSSINPIKNGTFDFVKNGFNQINNFTSPILNSLKDIITLPLQVMSNLLKSTNNLLSGNSFYFLLAGIGLLIVVGGVVYYQFNLEKFKRIA